MTTLSEPKLKLFLEELKKRFDVFDVRGDILPPKRYFFPPQETTFTLDKKTGKVSVPKSPKKFVLFGLPLRDLEAINYLDEIMKQPNPDFYYQQKRAKSILIGITDEAFDIPPGGDLIFRNIGKDGYEVVAVTKKGEKMLIDFRHLFSGAQKDSAPKINENKTMPEMRKLLLNPELLHDAVKWSWTGYPKIWDELMEKCLGCGICTYVCPLCHCFSTEDKVDISGDACSRCRKWDACTLPEFAKVAGGHNFHNGIRERYYNWFHHKFVRGYLEFGKSQCVGCGRCKKYCPARIDIEEVLVEIVKNFKLHQKKS